MKYVTFTFLLFIISCSKADFSTEHKINDLVAGFEPETQYRTKLRLAFGKAVALALGEKEFRDYIKDKSRKQGSLVFEELVFILIKDDILPSGRTVAQVIQDNEDSEVKSLFADDLIAQVLQDDPMVAIKLPDLFFDVEWDTDHLIPFVGVETALPILHNYSFYYHNGYHELLDDFNSTANSNIKYFYVAVLHSRDYLLLDVFTLTNEKGITLEEFLPQIFYSQHDALSDILKSGISLLSKPNKVIIHLRQAYEIWKDKNKFTGQLVGEIMPCGERCLRDCIEDYDVAGRVIMNGFELVNDLPLKSLGSLFSESFILSLKFSQFRENQKFVWTRPSRDNEFLPLQEVEVFKSDKSHKGKSFEVPLVNVIYNRITPNNRKWIDVNCVIRTDLKAGDFFNICISKLVYSDKINPFDPCPNLPSISNFASEKSAFANTSYGWCDTNTIGGDQMLVKFEL